MADTVYQPKYQKSYALVIGINEYSSNTNFDTLDTALRGAEETATTLLDDFGFDSVKFLPESDAKYANIMAYLKTELPATAQPDDRVLVYFAGHGTTRVMADGRKKGYLIPYGARAGQYHEYIEMIDDFVESSQDIRAKHVLFLLDACFTGLVFDKTRSGMADRSLVDELMTHRSVQVITAGAAQPVLDKFQDTKHSPFTGNLLALLKKAERSELLTATTLGLQIKQRVTDATYRKQVPQFGNVYQNEGGDFVFRFEAAEFQLPDDIRNLLTNKIAGARAAAVPELENYAQGNYPELAELAVDALRTLAKDPSEMVAAMAQDALLKVRSQQLSSDMSVIVESKIPGGREAAIPELEQLAQKSDPEASELAVKALKQLLEDESESVSSAAREVLERRSGPAIEVQTRAGKAERAAGVMVQGIWTGVYHQYDRAYPFKVIVEEANENAFVGSIIEPRPNWADKIPILDDRDYWHHLSSIFTGQVDRQTNVVTFTKKYTFAENYPLVVYTGRLDPELGEIDGKWYFPADPATSGRFQMRAG